MYKKKQGVKKKSFCIQYEKKKNLFSLVAVFCIMLCKRSPFNSTGEQRSVSRDKKCYVGRLSSKMTRASPKMNWKLRKPVLPSVRIFFLFSFFFRFVSVGDNELAYEFFSTS